uniref:Right handed beta helix domain-containing protein n=1 Tax=Amphimedon queenslandica TaxID=400682 RepID=A0A1X7T982_AMPQE
MSLLLVVVLLFFSSSCSVSSGQYYVSDDCSSVTQSPCHPLSVYVGDMSQYNNTIFYFIGTTISNGFSITAKNVTLHGMDQFSNVNCRNKGFIIHDSSHINISSLTIRQCIVDIISCNNVTITNSSFITNTVSSVRLDTVFDVKILSPVLVAYIINIWFEPLPVCSNELPHYSLILTNVTLNNNSRMELTMRHGTSYKLSITIDNVEFSNLVKSPFLYSIDDSLFYFLVTNSSFHDAITYGYEITISFTSKQNIFDCNYPGVEKTSTIVFEDCHFYHNPRALNIKSDMYLPGTINYHLIIRSCLLYDNINEGIFIDGTFLRLIQIDITDTELIGNGGNKILNSLSTSISLSNVTVANSTSTGLTLDASIVTIKNNLIFKNNTGVVGGGLALNDSSRLILSPAANLKFIDNHASYKGGGIYLEESTRAT